jgi:hypothetical protein
MTTTTPEYLIAPKSCFTADHDGLNCPHRIKQDVVTGRWYITMGHAAYNSPANNRDGYASRNAALAANKRAIDSATKRLEKSLPKLGAVVVLTYDVWNGQYPTVAFKGDEGVVTESTVNRIVVKLASGVEVVWHNRQRVGLFFVEARIA